MVRVLHKDTIYVPTVVVFTKQIHLFFHRERPKVIAKLIGRHYFNKKFIDLRIGEAEIARIYVDTKTATCPQKYLNTP